MTLASKIKHTSLKTKFVVLFCSVVLVSALGQAWLGLWKGSKTLEAELTTRALDLTRQLAGAVRYSTVTGDQARAEDAALAMADQLDVVYVQISGHDGEVLAHVGEWPASLDKVPDDLMKLGPREEAPIRIKGRDGQKWLVCYAPILRPVRTEWLLDNVIDEVDLYNGHGDGPQQAGSVLACVSTQRLAADLRHNLLLSFGILTASVTIGLVALLFLLKFLFKPLAEVAAASRAIAGGHLGLRVPVRSRDELGQLAKSFNQMAEALITSMAKLENYSHSLEKMVEKRTEELEAKTKALEKANEELQELDRMKSGFISNVSHELRTPLTSIKATAEILEDQLHALPTDQTKEFLSIIENQTDRLTRLINDVLDLSRLEQGSIPLDPRPLELGDVVGEAVTSLRSIAVERGIYLTSSLPEELPYGFADRDGLVQVLVNLISNAMKFTPAGGTVSIDVNYFERETRWGKAGKLVSGIVFSVSDTGVGIPQDKLESIFDKFKQLENAAWGKPSGSGLGLAISREIIHQFGGIIWAESETGKGSTFHFTLRPAAETVTDGSDEPENTGTLKHAA